MQYLGLAVLVGVVALLMLLIVLRLGWRPGWWLAWLKGNLLVLGLAASLAIGLAAWDLHYYRPLEGDGTVATLELRQLGPQRYEVLVNEAGKTRRLTLDGDQWELDAQVLRWAGLPHVLGLQDGYRLHRLRGRYLALEQQRQQDAQLNSQLHATPTWRDLWQWLDQLNADLWLRADAFTVRFMPLADGARFAIESGVTGLTPVPLNPAAVEALQRFE
ncbi:hypothetical protein ACFSB1_00675 [Halopseudomonas phragmitis]|uniref:Multidrug transporter n=2 Tax=Pseudomonadaceae TaxID=135621 RepID=A0A1V0B6F9_9GAMM|nr:MULTISPECIES: hypothetical protein [Pseudomonadaceae]AQZ95497.1 hypothetical protein BVH74_12370 [Halopseudomonas phragmitis]RHW22507.1 hypothetical protein C2846_02420 [Pseudomonas jilinensis]